MMTNDGELITETEPKAIVRELRARSYSPYRTEAEFMELTARRAEEQTGKTCRAWPHDAFIADLVTLGLLIED